MDCTEKEAYLEIYDEKASLLSKSYIRLGWNLFNEATAILS